LLKFLKSNRCSTCYTERALRICPRKGKTICWKCCNELRADTHCPESCPYSPKRAEDIPLPSFKADSRAESEHVQKLFLDLWVSQKSNLLEGQTPLDYAADNKDAALKWLSGYQFPPYFPLNYLMDKLKLPYSSQVSELDPEDVAASYLEAIVKLAFNDLRQHTINSSPRHDLAIRYHELISVIKVYSRISTFSIIHSGSGDDGHSALVYLELNHKLDWTMILSNANGQWKVRQNIAGNPQAYFEQNKVHSAIAEALGKGEDASAWEKINASLKTYPDSADLYYYRALYWQLVKRSEQAAVDFFNAAALDNAWPEPYIHLGNLCLSKSDFAQAREWYQEVLQLQPDNPQVLNNIAAAYAGEGNRDEARNIWERVLKLYPTFELARQNLEKMH